MNAPWPDPGAPATPPRPLHRDRPGREGLEAEVVYRLTSGIAPEPARRALVRGLDGDLTPRATLAQLLLASGSVTAVRELVDEITARADADSRAGDSLVRDRADALTRLFVENEAACEQALVRAATARGDGAAESAGSAVGWVPPAGRHPTDGEAPDAGAPDEVTYYERWFDRWVTAGG